MGVVLWQASPMSQTRIALGRFRSSARIGACGIPPGLYLLTEFAEDPEGEALYGTQHISITRPASVEIPALNIVRPSPVGGQIVIESGDSVSKRESTPQDLPSINIELERTDRIVNVAEKLHATVQSDGAFVVPRVIVGDQYWVNITKLRKPLYVMRAEVLGRDAYGEPLVSGTGDLKITLGSDGSHGQALLMTEATRSPGQKFVLLDRAAGSAPAPNQLLTAQADANGQFRFACVAPHEYLIAAFADLPDDQEWNPEIINLVRRSSFGVTAGQESQPISLKAIAAK